MVFLVGWLGGVAWTQSPAAGPLRRLESNPRYFTDGSGKAVLLVGSHNWGNFQDNGQRVPWARSAVSFRLRRLSRFLQKHNHNFFRLWRWEAQVDRCPAGGNRQVLPASSLEANRAQSRGRWQAQVQS